MTCRVLQQCPCGCTEDPELFFEDEEAGLKCPKCGWYTYTYPQTDEGKWNLMSEWNTRAYKEAKR